MQTKLLNNCGILFRETAVFILVFVYVHSIVVHSIVVHSIVVHSAWLVSLTRRLKCWTLTKCASVPVLLTLVTPWWGWEGEPAKTASSKFPLDVPAFVTRDCTTLKRLV